MGAMPIRNEWHIGYVTNNGSDDEGCTSVIDDSEDVARRRVWDKTCIKFKQCIK
jgi:hypothetical protein